MKVPLQKLGESKAASFSVSENRGSLILLYRAMHADRLLQYDFRARDKRVDFAALGTNILDFLTLYRREAQA
jgi:hypothetical protein